MTPRRQYPQRRFLHVDAVAETLGISVKSVGQWIRNGVMPASIVYQLRKGAPYLIDETGFWQWIDSTRIDRTNDLTARGEATIADSA